MKSTLKVAHDVGMGILIVFGIIFLGVLVLGVFIAFDDLPREAHEAEVDYLVGSSFEFIGEEPLYINVDNRNVLDTVRKEGNVNGITYLKPKTIEKGAIVRIISTDTYYYNRFSGWKDKYLLSVSGEKEVVYYYTSGNDCKEGSSGDSCIFFNQSYFREIQNNEETNNNETNGSLSRVLSGLLGRRILYIELPLEINRH